MIINEGMQEVQFIPFTFSITVENKDDLLHLLGCINNSTNNVERLLEFIDKRIVYEPLNVERIELYRFLLNKAKEFGLVDKNA